MAAKDIQIKGHNLYTRRTKVVIGQIDTREVGVVDSDNNEFIVTTVPRYCQLVGVRAFYADGDAAEGDITLAIDGLGATLSATLPTGTRYRGVDVDTSGITNKLLSADAPITVTVTPDTDGIAVGSIGVIVEFIDITETDGGKVRQG